LKKKVLSRFRLFHPTHFFHFQYAKKINIDLLDEKLVRGVSVDTWMEWFIKDIADKLGYKNEHSFRSSWIKQGRISIFQKRFGESYTDAVRKYRKQRTIE